MIFYSKWPIIISFLGPLPLWAVDIQTPTPAHYLREASSELVPLKGGEKLQIKKGESIYLIPDQSLPLLILNPSSESSQIVLQSADLEKISKAHVAQMVYKRVHEVIYGLRNIEALMSKKDYDQALQKLNELKTKHPAVASIYFLSASLNVLKNNSSQALEDLQKGLLLEPEDEMAKKLFNELKGKTK